jgi:cyclopropane-fatty-acyl-phospholipid synthase
VTVSDRSGATTVLMIAKLVIQRLFGAAGIEINGPNPWDPQVLDDRWYGRVLLHGSVGRGDSYMDGWWECSDIAGLIERIVKSGIHLRMPRLDVLQRKLRFGMIDAQDRTRSKRVAEVHYDEDPYFFDMMLGRTNNYTCGRWNGVSTLDAAQDQKMDLTCRKAGLGPGKTVLDIGCGWGGFLGYAAEQYGAHGIGLTISRTQREYAAERYHRLPVEFRLQDYRDFSGKVNTVVSICVIEHVGPSHYREYFKKACDSLARKDGFFVMQCILACDKRATMDPWTEKHIFPYGMLPMLGQIKEATKDVFYTLDQEFFPEDYVKTFVGWRENLVRHRDEIVEAYGLRYYRKYDFYLSLYIAGFGSGRISVVQFVFSPSDLRGTYEPIRLPV